MHTHVSESSVLEMGKQKKAEGTDDERESDRVRQRGERGSERDRTRNRN